MRQTASSILILITSHNVDAFTLQSFLSTTTPLSIRTLPPKCSLRKSSFLSQEPFMEDFDEDPNCVADACIVEEMELAKADECKASLLGDWMCKLQTKNRPEKIAGTAFFLLLDYILRKVFIARNIAFPSMMGGCVLLFSLLVSMEVVQPGVGDAVFEKLQPSANLLAKWLPVMFVPGLVLLPLAPKIGSSVEIAKVLSLVVGGFFFSLITTAYSVLGLRTLQGKIKTEPAEEETENKVTVAPSIEEMPKRVKPYSDVTLRNLSVGTAVFGFLAVYMSKIGHDMLTPVRTVFMLCATVGSYVFGANLPPRVTAFIHPLVTSTFFTLVFTNLFALLTESTFASVLKAYKVSSLCPVHTGAGDLLLYMLGPAVCSLSIAMYSRKKLMKDNLSAVLLGMLVSSAGALYSSAIYANVMNFPGEVLRLSVLTRAVTTALNIPLTQILGGNVPIAVSIVVLNGIFGASIGARVLNLLKIRDPVSRGLGMGGGAQGLGVASLLKEKDALPFAAINMILSAFFASVLISTPGVREGLKAIALAGV